MLPLRESSIIFIAFFLIALFSLKVIWFATILSNSPLSTYGAKALPMRAEMRSRTMKAPPLLIRADVFNDAYFVPWPLILIFNPTLLDSKATGVSASTKAKSISS